MQQFHDKGLGDVVNSWVSTGQNLPISADQIKSVLSNEHVQPAFAAKAGISWGRSQYGEDCRSAAYDHGSTHSERPGAGAKRPARDRDERAEVHDKNRD